jgi:alpha-glucosidase
VKGTVQLADLGGQADFPSGQIRLYYSVSVGGPSAYSEVIQPSPMGLVRSDRDFVSGLAFVSESAQRTVDSAYTMVTGKRSACRNHFNEKILTFQAAAGSRIELYLRAYDDGFAFRYRFPESNPAALTITSEATGFRPSAGSVMWMLPYNTTADANSPAYEDCWQRNVPVGAATGTTCKPSDGSWCLPALFRTPAGNWALLWESDVTAAYCNSHLSAAKQNVYRIAFPIASEGKGIGAVNPSSALPWATPWRVVMAGTSAGTILESTLSTDLAAPSDLGDMSWVKPGRSSWSWWSKQGSQQVYDSLAHFTDLAAQMGWEYTLVDGEWDFMTGGDLKKIVAYAKTRNVGVHAWYNSGGPTNSSGGTPRDKLYEPAAREKEFSMLNASGVKGVKIDFWLSDKQSMVKYYLDVFRDAAKHQIMVNIHGSTIPRGWQRTYPNLMTSEAVRGAEMYIFGSGAGDPQKFPWQQTMMPFTRNAVASMDWTPVTFTNNNNKRLTTFGHELALSVIFESGIQHFADRVSGYQTSTISPGAQAFLKQVPAAWDDTRYVEGYPGSWVVLARRKGSDWYAAGIAGDTARNVNVNLSFLRAAPAKYRMTLISDGATAATFAERSATVSATDSIQVDMPLRGGWVARFTDMDPSTARLGPAGPGGRSEGFMRYLVAGESFVLPPYAAGKPLRISLYGTDGTFLKSALVQGSTVDLKKDFGVPTGLYFIRFKAN